MKARTSVIVLILWVIACGLGGILTSFFGFFATIFLIGCAVIIAFTKREAPELVMHEGKWYDDVKEEE